MRYSKQSEEVLNAVLSSSTHPDAMTIYKMVKEKIPNISLGTVYRNLNTLAKEGLIKKIEIDEGNDRFDKTLFDHNHIKCINCHKVVDINSKISESEIRKIEEETGFKITDCNFNINGICSDCMKEGKK